MQGSSGGITKKDGTITLDVGASSDTTDHIFVPHPGYTPSTIVYNPTTGVMNLTINGHGFENGDKIKIDDNALTFTCAMDNHATDHTYPRASDPSSGKWLTVSNVTEQSFDVQVLTTIPQSNTTLHTFKSANPNCVKRASFISGGIYNHTYSTSVTNCVRHAGDLSLIHI